MKHIQIRTLLLLLMISTSLYAQEKNSSLNKEYKSNYSGYEIKGTVKDKTSGEPISFAPVFFINSSIGTTTDDSGKYLIQTKNLPSDSVQIQVMGYNKMSIAVNKQSKSSIINFQLERSSSYLEEVVVHSNDFDPVKAFIKNVIKRKPFNDVEAVAENYKYEAYNKVELDLLNFNRKKFERLPVPYLKKLGFIFDNIDSSSYDKPFLPLYLTEAISDYYYQRKPKKNKEVVRATQMKVIKNKNMTNSMSQYLGKIYLNINPYNNYVPFFDKEFVSPISNSALAFYKYTPVDTSTVDGYRVITFEFKPQRKGENCFEGTIAITDSTFAVQYFEADMPKNANINWVKQSSFYKEYNIVNDSMWFCTKENITAELQLTDDIIKTVGVVVRKTTSYKDFIINSPSITDTLNDKLFKRDIIVFDSTTNSDPEFWSQARHEPLSKNEQGIYNMYDSLEKDRSYKRLKTIGKILATGGYKFGPIELGPYWNAYSNNLIEGNRFQFTMGTTPKLFKDIYLNGYIAYGVQDNRFKYKIESRFILKRKPRMYLNFSYTRDIDNTVNYYDRVSMNNIATIAIRKNNIPLKFMFADNVSLNYYNEFSSGFSQELTVYRKIYEPYAPLPSTSIFRDGEGFASNSLTATEVNLKLRYAYKERFLDGNYLRYSLGSKYPIVDVRLALGLKDVFGGDYKYQRVTATVADNWRIPPFGQLYFNLFAGKYWGTVPYPILAQHPGNELYYYNKYAFNMMNQYEFISDEFVGANIEHNIGGGLLKYIPLIKKLKWRQFYNAKGLIGRLSAENIALNFNKGFTFRSLNNNPYLEVGTGIENIFKVFRVDFVWRITPKSLPNETVKRNFGVFGSLKFAF